MTDHWQKIASDASEELQKTDALIDSLKRPKKAYKPVLTSPIVPKTKKKSKNNYFFIFIFALFILALFLEKGGVIGHGFYAVISEGNLENALVIAKNINKENLSESELRQKATLIFSKIGAPLLWADKNISAALISLGLLALLAIELIKNKTKKKEKIIC